MILKNIWYLDSLTRPKTSNNHNRLTSLFILKSYQKIAQVEVYYKDQAEALLRIKKVQWRWLNRLITKISEKKSKIKSQRIASCFQKFTIF